MNARAREEVRRQIWWRLLREAGLPGCRWSANQLAQALGVLPETVVSWIEKGWLRASRLRVSQGQGWYRIRRRAIRRAICDVPAIQRAVIAAAGQIVAEQVRE
jgi:hypothetical protein